MGKVSGRGRPLPWLHPPHTYPSSRRSPPLPIPIAVTQGGAPRLYAQGSKNAHLPLEVRPAPASRRRAALPLARLALGPGLHGHDGRCAVELRVCTRSRCQGSLEPLKRQSMRTDT